MGAGDAPVGNLGGRRVVNATEHVNAFSDDLDSEIIAQKKETLLGLCLIVAALVAGAALVTIFSGPLAVLGVALLGIGVLFTAMLPTLALGRDSIE